MIEVSSRVYNAHNVLTTIEGFSDNALATAKIVGLEHLIKARKAITVYPPMLPNQKYVRTGIYGRSWMIFKNKDGYLLSGLAVQRGRAYEKYVAGDLEGNWQAGIHQGRWKMSQKAYEEMNENLATEIETRISTAARRINTNG